MLIPFNFLNLMQANFANWLVAVEDIKLIKVDSTDYLAELAMDIAKEWFTEGLFVVALVVDIVE